MHENVLSISINCEWSTFLDFLLVLSSLQEEHNTALCKFLVPEFRMLFGSIFLRTADSTFFHQQIELRPDIDWDPFIIQEGGDN